MLARWHLRCTMVSYSAVHREATSRQVQLAPSHPLRKVLDSMEANYLFLFFWSPRSLTWRHSSSFALWLLTRYGQFLKNLFAPKGSPVRPQLVLNTSFSVFPAFQRTMSLPLLSEDRKSTVHLQMALWRYRMVWLCMKVLGNHNHALNSSSYGQRNNIL